MIIQYYLLNKKNNKIFEKNKINYFQLFVQKKIQDHFHFI